jgi:predicted nuclease with TOPRIM domain
MDDIDRRSQDYRDKSEILYEMAENQRAAWSSVEKRLDKIGDIHSRNEEHIISLASEVAGLKERMRLIEEGAGRERMNTVAVRVAIIGAMAALSAAIITAVR